MSQLSLKLAHLYPKLLNIYGDRGNILSFKRRTKWRDIDLEIDHLEIGEHDKKLADYDLLFIGGGQDAQQELVAPDLMTRKQEFKDVIEDGAVVLAICGGYQIMGDYYQSAGNDIAGLEILGLHTKAPKSGERLIGNVVLESNIDGTYIKADDTIVGFENHSGKTYLNDLSEAMAKVKKGFGNNSEDKTEGIIYKNVFGTYLHGSLLPKNPKLADELIFRAMQRKYPDTQFLIPIDDEIESQAHQAALSLK